MSQRVSKTNNGKRPGYRGDAAYNSYSSSSTGSNRGTASKSDLGGGAASGPSGDNDRNDRNFTVPLNQNPTVSQSLKDSKAPIVSGSDFTDSANAYKVGVYQPKEIPAYVPGGMYAKALRKILGTPFTNTGKISTAKKRMEYINSLPPRERKAMIDRLGLAEDNDYEEGDVPYGDIQYEALTGDPLAMGKNIYGIDSLDIINYDGEYMKKYGPKPFEGTGGNDQTILPYPYNVQQPDEEVPEDTGPEYRFGTGQGIGADVTRGYYSKGGKAEGGIMELRARRAFGGIMDRVTGRKAYGLGSIFKKVGKAAKKVLSSDIGKAAIAGAAFYYGGGGGNPFTAAGRAKFSAPSFFSKSNPLLFSGEEGARKFNPFKASGLFTLGGALMGPAKQDPSLMATRSDTQLIDPLTGKPSNMAEMRASIEAAKEEAAGDENKLAAIDAKYNNMLNLGQYLPYPTYGAANGGRIGKAEGGLMDLGGMEKDYRNDGGFVPIGEYEKKDDVPARLSVNEFVFTADAVRGAGQGDIDKGAEIMENMMKNLENGGTVSEESQGNKGAQQMFETSERLGAII